MMDTFPQPLALPLMPFALHMVLASLASFPPMLALLSSLKEIQDARSAPALALLHSAQAAGKCPSMSHYARGAPRAVSPPTRNIPRDTAPSGWGHLRSRGDNDTAHPVEATVSQVQALGSELHLPALEVLLVEDNDLGVQGKGWMRTGMLRLLLCDPTPPCVSKPSCSS